MQRLIPVLFTKFTFLLIGIVFITGFYFSAKDLNPMASTYPIGVISILIVIIGWNFIAEFVEMIRNKDQNNIILFEILKEWKKPIYMLVVFLIYIYIINFLGFYTSTALFLTTLFFLLGKFHLKYLINVSVIIFVSYFVFTRWLQVPVPSGLLL